MQFPPLPFDTSVATPVAPVLHQAAVPGCTTEPLKAGTAVAAFADVLAGMIPASAAALPAEGVVAEPAGAVSGDELPTTTPLPTQPAGSAGPAAPTGAAPAPPIVAESVAVEFPAACSAVLQAPARAFVTAPVVSDGEGKGNFDPALEGSDSGEEHPHEPIYGDVMSAPVTAMIAPAFTQPLAATDVVAATPAIEEPAATDTVPQSDGPIAVDGSLNAVGTACPANQAMTEPTGSAAGRRPSPMSQPLHPGGMPCKAAKQALTPAGSMSAASHTETQPIAGVLPSISADSVSAANPAPQPLSSPAAPGEPCPSARGRMSFPPLSERTDSARPSVLPPYAAADAEEPGSDMPVDNPRDASFRSVLPPVPDGQRIAVSANAVPSPATTVTVAAFATAHPSYPVSAAMPRPEAAASDLGSIAPVEAGRPDAPLPTDAAASGPGDSATGWRFAVDTVAPESKPPLPGDPAQEKFAGNLPRLVAAQPSARFGVVKTVVRAGSKGVAESEPPFGTSAAQGAATMPAGSTLARPNIFHVNAVDLGAAVRTAAAAVPPQAAPAAGVHQAVEAALNATDRLAHGVQHSVNLRFDIGGNDLSVRVELRGETVHTTFRTDSAELRTALSTEWQAVTGSAPADRSGRLATPVFTSNEHGAGSANDSGTRHHDQPADGPEPSLPRFPVPHTGGRLPVSAPVGAANTTRTASVNSVHLHTLA